jgi:hypothetical protein
MRRLLYHAGQASPVILYPFALILGFLLAFAWWLVLVGIILPVFATMVGARRHDGWGRLELSSMRDRDIIKGALALSAWALLSRWRTRSSRWSNELGVEPATEGRLRAPDANSFQSSIT